MKKISFRYYVHYYWMIISDGLIETLRFYSDWKNSIGNIISGVIAILLLFHWGGVAAVFNPDLAINAAIGGAVIWAIFVLLWNVFVVTPVKQFRIKQSETFGLTWKDIEIKQYKTDHRDGFDVAFAMTSHKELYNRRWFICNVTADIIEFTQGGIVKDTTDAKLPILQHVNSTFRSSTVILNPEGEKEAGACTILAVAKIRDGKASLLSKDDVDDLEIKKGSNCLVRIKLNGCLDNPDATQLIDCDIFCTLYFDGNKIDVVKWNRTVNYEY